MFVAQVKSGPVDLPISMTKDASSAGDNWDEDAPTGGPVEVPPDWWQNEADILLGMCSLSRGYAWGSRQRCKGRLLPIHDMRPVRKSHLQP